MRYGNSIAQSKKDANLDTKARSLLPRAFSHRNYLIEIITVLPLHSMP